MKPRARPTVKTIGAGVVIATICLLALPATASRAQSVTGAAIYLGPETQTPIATMMEACSGTTPYTPMSVSFIRRPPSSLEAGMELVVSYVRPDLMDVAVLVMTIQQSGPVYQVSGIATGCIPPGAETSLSVVYPPPLTALYVLYGRGIVQAPGGPSMALHKPAV